MRPPAQTRRAVILACWKYAIFSGMAASAAVALAQAPVRSAPVVLPVPSSLHTELAAALKAGQPLVLMVSLDGCPYCKIARENYLAPLVRETGLRVVQINMQHRDALKDLQGRDTTQAQQIADLKVSVAPTLLFYGRGGQEAAPRLEGMSSLDLINKPAGVYDLLVTDTSKMGEIVSKRKKEFGI